MLLLASVAGMQGRIAMWHALGEAVAPLRLKTVAANVFTHPEIATVGIGYDAIASGEVPARTVTLPLATNARAKMQGQRDGFVKIYCRPATGVVIGGVVVAPDASELIFPVALAVQRGLTVDRAGWNNRGLPVVVRLGRRGRPAADAARRSGLTELTAIMANHGDFSPEARERAHRTVLVADVFADNAEVIVAELPNVARRRTCWSPWSTATHEFGGTHHVERSDLVERVPELEDGGGWAMVFSPGVDAADIRRRTDEMASIASSAPPPSTASTPSEISPSASDDGSVRPRARATSATACGRRRPSAASVGQVARGH